MSDTAESYEVALTSETYQVVRQDNEDGPRICFYNREQLRFSLPNDTPVEQVRKFIQVYDLGFVDGQSARSAAVENHIRGRLNLAAQRLGHAIGKLKRGTH